MHKPSICLLAAVSLWTVSALRAQNAPSAETGRPAPGTYVIGPEDQITIEGLDAEEFANKPVRVDTAGDINLPLVGRVHVGGLTIRECELALNTQFARFVRNPQLTVNVTELRSQPVSVVGAVNTPGVIQVQGQKSLLELLSMAGGLKPEAGYSVKITRQIEYGKIPLANSALDGTGRFQVAEVSLKALMEAKDPAANIRVMPHDVITVPRADIVYVVGEVKRAGGFPLNEKRNMTVLQALSLAEGLDSDAKASQAKILRAAAGNGQRQEVPIDLKKLFAGKGEDLALNPDDILFIPSNVSRKVAVRALETAVATASGVVIWRSARY